MSPLTPQSVYTPHDPINPLGCPGGVPCPPWSVHTPPMSPLSPWGVHVPPPYDPIIPLGCPYSPPMSPLTLWGVLFPPPMTPLTPWGIHAPPNDPINPSGYPCPPPHDPINPSGCPGGGSRAPYHAELILLHLGLAALPRLHGHVVDPHQHLGGRVALRQLLGGAAACRGGVTP